MPTAMGTGLGTGVDRSPNAIKSPVSRNAEESFKSWQQSEIKLPSVTRPNATFDQPPQKNTF
jgi:hypothetical protein